MHNGDDKENGFPSHKKNSNHGNQNKSNRKKNKQAIYPPHP